MKKLLKWDSTTLWKGESKMPGEEKPKTADEVMKENEEELKLVRLYDIVTEISHVEISEIDMEDGQKNVVIILKDTVYDREIGFKKAI